MSQSIRQSGFGLYFGFVRLHILSQLQYRGWMIGLLPNLVYVITDPLDAVLMLDRFGSVGSWTASRILLVYALALLSFGLAELLTRGFDFFPVLVRDGSFDRILLRPRSAFLQAMTLRFNLSRLNRVIAGLLLAVLTLSAQGVKASFSDVLMLVCAVAGGVLCYAGIFIISSFISFFTVASLEYINIFTNGSYQVTKVPPMYLPAWMRRLFTFFMPMFIFTYYPAAAVCGWGEPYAAGWLALPVCALFFAVAAALWKIGVRHYKSTGS